jgi:hypoxanthine-DNA glycosylase
MHITHTIPPVYNEHSRLLLLGTMPSPKSREAGFFYGHPQNRLWKILQAVYGVETGTSVDEKRTFLLDHFIAMWDVLAECDIENAADSSIKNAKTNDFSPIFAAAEIAVVFTTGKTAYKLYQSLCEAAYHVPCYCLPSPSPANCAVNFETLCEAYKVLRDFTDKN